VSPPPPGRGYWGTFPWLWLYITLFTPLAICAGLYIRGKPAQQVHRSRSLLGWGVDAGWRWRILLRRRQSRRRAEWRRRRRRLSLMNQSATHVHMVDHHQRQSEPRPEERTFARQHTDVVTVCPSNCHVHASTVIHSLRGRSSLNCLLSNKSCNTRLSNCRRAIRYWNRPKLASRLRLGLSSCFLFFLSRWQFERTRHGWEMNSVGSIMSISHKLSQ